MIIRFFTLSLGLLFYPFILSAHELSSNHQECLSALDYSGCLKYYSTTNSPRSISSFNWRSYGPIKVNWSSWHSKDDNYIAPSINSSGDPIFIAINCTESKINVTGKQQKWKGWAVPTLRFEEVLLTDFCQSALRTNPNNQL